MASNIGKHQRDEDEEKGVGKNIVEEKASTPKEDKGAEKKDED